MNLTENLIFTLARIISARVDSAEISATAANGSQASPALWKAQLGLAKVHLAHTQSTALESLVEAMEMQDRREAEEAHITAETARGILRDAAETAVRSQVEPVVRDLLTQMMELQEVLLDRNLGVVANAEVVRDRGRHFARNPLPAGERSVVLALVHALDYLLVDFVYFDELFALGEQPSRQAVTEESVATAKAAAIAYLGLPAEDEKETPSGPLGYFKQRSEALLRRLQKAGVVTAKGPLSHSQLLQFMANAEGFKSYQALKSALGSRTLGFCPHCGAPATLECVDSVFCEMGEYDGKAHGAEGTADQYGCSRCNRRVTDWQDFPDTEEDGDASEETSSAPEQSGMVHSHQPMREAIERLQAAYGQDGEHPDFGRESWHDELRARDTRLECYWEWVVHQVEANQQLFPWERDELESVQIARAAGLTVTQSKDSSAWAASGPALETGLLDEVDEDYNEQVVWDEAAEFVVEAVFNRKRFDTPAFWNNLPLETKLSYVREVFCTQA